MLQNVFCDNLKRFRLAKNLTQEQVAAALGINSQTVSRWELGTAFCNDLYGLASLSKRQGDYKKAAAYYMQIAQIMKNRGCDVEQQHAVKMAQECRGKTD